MPNRALPQEPLPRVTNDRLVEGLVEGLAGRLAALSQPGYLPFRNSLLHDRSGPHQAVQLHILAIEEAPRQQRLMDATRAGPTAT